MHSLSGASHASEQLHDWFEDDEQQRAPPVHVNSQIAPRQNEVEPDVGAVVETSFCRRAGGLVLPPEKKADTPRAQP